MSDIGSLLQLPVVVVAAAVVAAFAFIRFTSGPSTKLPPGPRGWPVIGCLVLLRSGFAHRTFHQLAKQYGPLLSMRVGSVLTVIVSSPDMAREFMQTHDEAFANRPRLIGFEQMNYGGKDMTTASYGPYWRFVRKIAVVELFSPKRVKQFETIRRELVLETMSTILKLSEGGKALQLREIIFRLSANNISLMLMKKKFYGGNVAAGQEEETSEFILAVKALFDAAGPNIGDFIPFLKPFDLQGMKAKFEKVFRRFDQIAEKVLDEHFLEHSGHSNAEEAPSFVQILMSIKSLQSDDGKDVDQRIMVKALVQNILLGGTDTLGNAIHWAMVALIKHPEVVKRVQKELDEVVGSGRIVNESDLPQLHYLEAVIMETFRLYPTTALLVPHRNRETCIVAGYRIPADSFVLVNNWAIGRDPKIWENPLEFNPSRFLNSPLKMQGQHFELLPFGAGRRMCPASSLALAFIRITVAHLLHAFNWALPPGQSADDLDITEKPDHSTTAASIEFCPSLRDPAGPYSSLLQQHSSKY